MKGFFFKKFTKVQVMIFSEFRAGTREAGGWDKKVFSDRVLFLLSLNIVRFLISGVYYSKNYLTTSADEYPRALAAYWLADSFSIGQLLPYQAAWMPLERIVNALAIKITDDLILGPRITVFIFSVIFIVGLFILIESLFEFRTAVVSTCLITVQPWMMWLSVDPMLDEYGLAFIPWGVFYSLKWLSDRKFSSLTAAVFFFNIAEAFFVQAWLLVGAFLFLATVLRLRSGDSSRLALLFAGCTFYPLLYLFSCWWLYQDAFVAFHTHMNYAYGGDVTRAGTFLQRVFYYPKLFLEWTPWWTIPLLVLSLVLEQNYKRAAQAVAFYLFFALFFYSASTIFIGPSVAARERFSLPFTVTALILAGNGLCLLFSFVRAKGPVVKSTLLCACMLQGIWTLHSYPRFPQYVNPHGVGTGKAALKLVESGLVYGLIEREGWDWYPVLVGLRHKGSLHFDREETAPFSRSPFQTGEGAMFLVDGGKFDWIVLASSKARENLLGTGRYRLFSEQGGWGLFLRNDLELNRQPR